MLCAQRYKQIRELGRGAYGVVYLCKPNNARNDSTHNSDLCVVKVVQVDEQDKASVMKEAMVMRRIGECDFLVRYLDSFLHANALYIVMDYCSRGDLHHLIATKGKVPPSCVHRYSYQVAAALAFLHRNMIVHRDVKPKNIFLSDLMDAKLGDLGVCKVRMHSRDMATTFVGTALYLSPEVIQSKHYDEKCDIWSLGCVIYEMAEGRPLFNARSLPMVVNMILAGPRRPLKLSTQQTQDVLRSLSRCLQRAPAARPHARDLSTALSVKGNAPVAKSYMSSAPSTHEAPTPQQSNRRLYTPLAPKFTPPARSPYAVKLRNNSQYVEKARRPRARVAVQRGPPAFRTPVPPSPAPAPPPLPTSMPCAPPPIPTGSPPPLAKPVESAPLAVPTSMLRAPPPIVSGIVPPTSAKPVEALPPAVSPELLEADLTMREPVEALAPALSESMKETPPSAPQEPVGRSFNLPSIKDEFMGADCAEEEDAAEYDGVGEVYQPLPKDRAKPGERKKIDANCDSANGEPGLGTNTEQQQGSQLEDKEQVMAQPEDKEKQQVQLKDDDEVTMDQLDEQAMAQLKDAESQQVQLKDDEETMDQLDEQAMEQLEDAEALQVQLKDEEQLMAQLEGAEAQQVQLKDEEQAMAQLEDKEKQQVQLKEEEQAMVQFEDKERMMTQSGEEEQALAELGDKEKQQVQLKDEEQAMSQQEDKEKQQVQLKDEEQAMTQLKDKEKQQVQLKEEEQAMVQFEDKERMMTLSGEEEQALTELGDKEKQQVQLKDEEQAMTQLEDKEKQQVQLEDEKLQPVQLENEEQQPVQLENEKQQVQQQDKTVEQCAEKLSSEVKNLDDGSQKNKGKMESAGQSEEGRGENNRAPPPHKKEEREDERQEWKKTQERGNNESLAQRQDEPKQTPKEEWTQEDREPEEKRQEQQPQWHIASSQHDAAPLRQHYIPDRTRPAATADETSASVPPEKADIQWNLGAFPKKARALTPTKGTPGIVPAPLQADAPTDKPALPSAPDANTQGNSAAVALPKAETSTPTPAGKVTPLLNPARGVSYRNNARTAKSKSTSAPHQRQPIVSLGRGPLAKGPGVRLRSRRAQYSQSGGSFNPPSRRVPRPRGTPRTNVRQFFNNAIAEWKRGAGPIPAYVRKQVVEQAEKAKQEVLALPSFCVGDSSEFSFHATDMCKVRKP